MSLSAAEGQQHRDFALLQEGTNSVTFRGGIHAVIVGASSAPFFLDEHETENANAEPCLGGYPLPDATDHEAAARGDSVSASDVVDLHRV